MSVADPPSHAARLFKTLVLAGASLGVSSCGGESRRTEDMDPGAGSGSGGALSVAGGGGTNGGSAGGAPAGGYPGQVESCAHSAQRSCACTYTPPINQRCTLNHPFSYYGPALGYQLARMDCVCDASRPSGPEACAYTQQFTCSKYLPEYEECDCNEAAPRSADDCGPIEYYQCDGADPEIGCECVARIL